MNVPAGGLAQLLVSALVIGGTALARETSTPQPTPAATPDRAPGIKQGVVQTRDRPGGEGGNSVGPVDARAAQPLPSPSPSPSPG